MNALKSTLLHSLEFVLVLLAGFTLCHLFNIGNEDMKLIISTLIAAFVKYARVSPSIPVKDYVNPVDQSAPIINDEK